jgi:hypothetical protein
LDKDKLSLWPGLLSGLLGLIGGKDWIISGLGQFFLLGLREDGNRLVQLPPVSGPSLEPKCFPQLPNFSR